MDNINLIIRKNTCGHWLIACRAEIGVYIVMQPIFHAESFSDVLVILNARNQEELDRFLASVPIGSDTFAY